ncbi:MAG: DNA topoisomerase 3 [Muribaculaceae bacterium]|jgi:DNA topoisomerase-3|nr:DNA topoisomerase 3 [Muribaculaceae bacterium]
MIVCITEKPSVAKDIAAILGANERHDGYFEGSGYRVTWTFGHLCSLLEPNDYKPQWKHWSLSALPMIPEKFDIKLIDDKGIRHQFEIIERLFHNADEIINCGDAGQEGELIQRWVMKKAGIGCPVRRLWISSLTDESIREGFKGLKSQQEYDRLFYAGLSRAIGDWILGMNATRLYTLKYSSPGHVLSIGRVQTPTLALIVRRQKEIAEFVPKDTWEAHTIYRGANFTYTGDRFDTEAVGQKLIDEISSEPFVIDDVTKKKGREAPPRLFDLTSLQVECNKKFAWTADQTLRLIQSLYEKKLTTYPRVDTTYLSEDIYPKIGDTLRRMTPYARITEPILQKPIPKSKKIFDNSKVTDHHAIIPTGQSPAGIEGDEKRLYHLIAMRFIAAFYSDCEFEATTVNGHAAEYGFKAMGKVITAPGWRVLFADNKAKDDETQAKDDDSDDRILPVFTKGESGPHEPFLAKKTSQPPKYYTEGTLLRAMETAGKNIDDEDLREALKENGIGRPSTRAAIIETLFKRRYIYRERKNIIATRAGIDLIASINEELLKSAALTGIWENKLRRIERGDYSPVQFIQEISTLIRQIVFNVLSDNSNRRIITDAPTETKKETKTAKTEKKPRAPRTTKYEQVACPVCRRGHILKGRTAFGCSRYAEGCGFRLPFTDCPADTTPARLKKRLESDKK